MGKIKKNKHIPDRWLSYTSLGKQIEGTKFLAFKVPLNEVLCSKVAPSERFSPAMLMEAEPRLALIIDLTNTNRYYDKEVFLANNIDYTKIYCEGHVIPSDIIVQTFFNAVDKFLSISKSEDSLIGVHCTHGVNRTGYLVCRYMIQKMGKDPQEAITLFQEARGHEIERKNYIADLLSLTTDISNLIPLTNRQKRMNGVYEHNYKSRNNYTSPHGEKRKIDSREEPTRRASSSNEQEFGRGLYRNIKNVKYDSIQQEEVFEDTRFAQHPIDIQNRDDKNDFMPFQNGRKFKKTRFDPLPTVSQTSINHQLDNRNIPFHNESNLQAPCDLPPENIPFQQHGIPNNQLEISQTIEASTISIERNDFMPFPNIGPSNSQSQIQNVDKRNDGSAQNRNFPHVDLHNFPRMPFHNSSPNVYPNQSNIDPNLYPNHNFGSYQNVPNYGYRPNRSMQQSSQLNYYENEDNSYSRYRGKQSYSGRTANRDFERRGRNRQFSNKNDDRSPGSGSDSIFTKDSRDKYSWNKDNQNRGKNTWRNNGQQLQNSGGNSWAALAKTFQKSKDKS